MSSVLTPSVERLVALGVTTFVEIGPGTVLSGLIKKISREARVAHVERVDDALTRHRDAALHCIRQAAAVAGDDTGKAVAALSQAAAESAKAAQELAASLKPSVVRWPGGCRLVCPRACPNSSPCR